MKPEARGLLFREGRMLPAPEGRLEEGLDGLPFWTMALSKDSSPLRSLGLPAISDDAKFRTGSKPFRTLDAALTASVGDGLSDVAGGNCDER